LISAREIEANPNSGDFDNGKANEATWDPAASGASRSLESIYG
jgi:hypothetical protein